MLNKKQAAFASAVIIVLVLMVIGFWYLYTKNKIDQNNNPKVINQLIKDNAPAIDDADVANTEKARNIDATDHVNGELTAPVQMIVYNDFECDFCAKFQETLKKIKEVYGDKVIVAFRHFPLRSNPNAYLAALAAECAGEQGKFWEMHDRLFTDNLQNTMNLERYSLDAKELELDMEKFSSCIEEERGKQKIQADIEEAKRIGVAGSPQTFINGKIYPGAYPFEDFTDSAGIEREGMKSVIDREIKNQELRIKN